MLGRYSIAAPETSNDIYLDVWEDNAVLRAQVEKIHFTNWYRFITLEGNENQRQLIFHNDLILED